jgi:hypothetical protein
MPHDLRRPTPVGEYTEKGHSRPQAPPCRLGAPVIRGILRPGITTATSPRYKVLYLPLCVRRPQQIRFCSLYTGCSEIIEIQHCPNEVRDMVFQIYPFNPPAIVFSVTLTCSQICAKAQSYPRRCPQTVEQVKLFAIYLTKLFNKLPMAKRNTQSNMAVFWKYPTPRGHPWRNPDEAEKATQYTHPFIISRTTGPPLHAKNIVNPSGRSKISKGLSFSSNIPSAITANRKEII